MRILTLTAATMAMMTLSACSGTETSAENEEPTQFDRTTAQAEAKTEVLGEIAAQGADLSGLPSGTYTADQGHAYVAFQYWHQGFSKPIIRWGTTDATLVFDEENPENSTLTVTLPTADIDTGVAAWDEHIKSADFFDVETYPEVTFVSTDIEQLADGYGTLTGNLTIKDVTRPFTLTGTVNKVGQHFRSGADMFGVSAKGQLKRSDFGVDTYAPMADDIEIMVEVEFLKAE